jgi:putative phosphoserine phosphatase/1-acylglycerol-3-phosphate O-acyltransferase
MLSTILMGTISSESSNRGYIAFFDLDRTMIGSVSGRALVKAALKKGLMKYPDLLKALYLSLSYSLRLRDPVMIMDEMVSWVAGLSERDFTDLCDSVFKDVLLPSLFRETGTEIEMHRRNNGKTVILSSSLWQVCRHFSEHLGMDDVICSELEVKNGVLTGKAMGRLCFGPQKLVRMKEYCERNRCSPSKAWYYADSESDVPVLEAVEHPVCVNPDKRLLKRALASNWKVCHWK